MVGPTQDAYGNQPTRTLPLPETRRVVTPEPNNTHPHSGHVRLEKLGPSGGDSRNSPDRTNTESRGAEGLPASTPGHLSAGAPTSNVNLLKQANNATGCSSTR